MLPIKGGTVELITAMMRAEAELRAAGHLSPGDEPEDVTGLNWIDEYMQSRRSLNRASGDGASGWPVGALPPWLRAQQFHE